MNDGLFDSEPRLDQSAVDQIVQLEPIRPGLLAHLITVFQKNFKELMDSLDSQLAAGKHDSLRIAFHSLKGASASLGAQRLSKMAGFAESLAADEFSDGSFEEIRTALEAEFGHVRTALLQAQVDRA